MKSNDSFAPTNFWWVPLVVGGDAPLFVFPLFPLFPLLLLLLCCCCGNCGVGVLDGAWMVELGGGVGVLFWRGS